MFFLSCFLGNSHSLSHHPSILGYNDIAVIQSTGHHIVFIVSRNTLHLCRDGLAIDDTINETFVLNVDNGLLRYDKALMLCGWQHYISVAAVAEHLRRVVERCPDKDGSCQNVCFAANGIEVTLLRKFFTPDSIERYRRQLFQQFVGSTAALFLKQVHEQFL